MMDSSEDVSVSEEAQARITERVLEAEKQKLNLDNPIGIINEIEQIVEEEIY